MWDKSGAEDVAVGEGKPIRKTMATVQARTELRLQQKRDGSVHPRRAQPCFQLTFTEHQQLSKEQNGKMSRDGF